MISEAQTYIERLREMRANMFKAAEGLNSTGLNWKPTRRDTNSAYVLMNHLLGSEKHWVLRTIGGQVIERDRDAEFKSRGRDAATLRVTFEATARESEAILGQLSAADLDAMRKTNYGQSTVRWCILHLLEHYAEHVGQMTLTRQMWEANIKTRQAKRPKAKKQKVKAGKKR